VPVSADVAELDAVDAALLCLPSPMVTATAHAVFRRHKERLDRLAQRQHRRPRRDPWSCRELRPVSWLGLS
jgi:hypothetical protein